MSFQNGMAFIEPELSAETVSFKFAMIFVLIFFLAWPTTSRNNHVFLSAFFKYISHIIILGILGTCLSADFVHWPNNNLWW